MLNATQQSRLNTIRSIDRSGLVTKNKQYNPDITSMQVNAVIEMSGKHYVIMAIHRYQEISWNFRKDERWNVYEWEMFCLETGETMYLDWEQDDSIEMWVSERKLDPSPDVYGTSSWEQFLDDDRLDSSLTLSVGGKIYRYSDDESWAAKFYRNGTGHPEYARFYEFFSGTDCLTVEVWGKDGKSGTEVWISKRTPPSVIKLIVSGKGQ